MPDRTRGCCCGDDGDPCNATIVVNVACEEPVHIDVIGATVLVGDIDPEPPYSGGVAAILFVQIPHSSAEVTVVVSGTGEHTTAIPITVLCDDWVNVYACNIPTTRMPTTRVMTVVGFADGAVTGDCPMEGAIVEHTGCLTGATGATDSDGYVTLALDQCHECFGPSFLSITPGEGYGAEAAVVGGPGASCVDGAPQVVHLLPDANHIGHGTYGEPLGTGFVCSGRYLPYEGATYADNDGFCALAFIAREDLPYYFAPACTADLPPWVWAGMFSFAPPRIGKPTVGVGCEGVPNCLAADNTDGTMVPALVLVWVEGTCDGATVHVRRCSPVLELPTNCYFIDSECVYAVDEYPCIDAYAIPEVKSGSATTACAGPSMTAAGTAIVTGGYCSAGGPVDWEVTCPI